jgi:pimeloyl-ACP methyl ester carboxylesterase
MRDGAFAIDLSDGRRLEGWSSGGESGPALLLELGTPSAGIAFAPMVEAAGSRGCTFVTYSRPGYAGSTRRPGRAVADCAEDVADIARALEIERLHVVGWSGGGPHALACAALLPELVASVATLAGVAPWTDGFDWLDKMAAENREEFDAARAGEKELERFLTTAAAEHANVTAATIADALGGLVTDVDRAALDGSLAEYLATLMRAALSSGIWGWFDDDLAFVRDWGFSLDDIAVPVTVWQGREDAMVPDAHGEWLARRVPSARPMLFENEGHLSLLARFGDVVDDLLARAEAR